MTQAADAHLQCRFIVEAGSCPELLPRVIGLFSQQRIAIEYLWAHDDGTTNRLVIQSCGQDLDRAENFALKIDRIIAVRSVKLSFCEGSEKFPSNPNEIKSDAYADFGLKQSDM